MGIAVWRQKSADLADRARSATLADLQALTHGLRSRLRLSRERYWIAEAEEFALLGAWDASVCGQAIKMVEAGCGGPRRKGTAAHLAEFLGEAENLFAGARISRRNGAPRARMAALECDCADFEAHGVIFVGAEELVLPKCGDAVDFECGAETFTRFVQRHAGEPVAYGFEGSGRDDGRTGHDAVIGIACTGVADNDGLLEIFAEPFCGGFGVLRKFDADRLDAAMIFRRGKADAGKIRLVRGANQVNSRCPFAVNPFAIGGKERPDAVEFEAAIGADARFVDADRIERLDRMQTDAG